MKATVKWFNDSRGFGFLSGEDGQDYFVSFRNIEIDGNVKHKNGKPWRTLRDGQEVEIVETVETHQGMKAARVRRILPC